MAGRLIFGGVDGTGDFFNRSYEATFANSHVKVLSDYWNEGPAHYRRGPWWQGDWTYVEAYRIHKAVVADWKKDDAVFLAGYSRGGAAVIEIAKWLRDDGIPVECLVLLDPVDRTRMMGDSWNGWQDSAIVDTVRQVIYAQRSPNALSRESFGNCGLVRHGNIGLDHKRQFHATHGGVGGTPWSKPVIGVIDEGAPDFKTNVTVPMDNAGSAAVQKWIWRLLFNAIERCKERMAKPGGPVEWVPGFQLPGQQPTSRPGGAAGNSGKERIHVVVQGDWLSKIALKYYGDAMKYKVIHQANLKVIGPNPDVIKPGQRLVIP